ncbi:hypothetical protein BU23DRAFT_626174 [Bimuria novae-zelandiae CBS 107.79]|uniref:Uncharacterized protein n=1 Tax=Bimuria novae-zelandiae CBS 107.79 TaxID=1447943 RepID=A0A6A5VU34_9PLEO|nr:hypothetical protein BU23DRAFT_626174 [Bimuria novae-zelandiae CBS 107.79]
MSVTEWIKTFRTAATSQTAYSKVHDDDSSKSTETLLTSRRLQSPPRSHYILTAGNIFLFLISLALFTFSFTRSVTDSQCVNQLFTWCKPSIFPRSPRPTDAMPAPAFEAIEYHEEVYTGAFRQTTEYRGTPTLEIDERWLKLWDYREFDVPEEKWGLMNRTGDSTITRTS